MYAILFYLFDYFLIFTISDFSLRITDWIFVKTENTITQSFPLTIFGMVKFLGMANHFIGLETFLFVTNGAVILKGFF